VLRSVDIQQILLQTTSVEKIQQVQQQHMDMEKKYFALPLQEEMNQKQSEVQDTKEAEEAKIREEEKRRQQKEEYKFDYDRNKQGSDKRKKRELEEIDQGKILDLIV